MKRAKHSAGRRAYHQKRLLRADALPRALAVLRLLEVPLHAGDVRIEVERGACHQPSSDRQGLRDPRRRVQLDNCRRAHSHDRVAVRVERAFVHAVGVEDAPSLRASIGVHVVASGVWRRGRLQHGSRRCCGRRGRLVVSSGGPAFELAELAALSALQPRVVDVPHGLLHAQPASVEVLDPLRLLAIAHKGAPPASRREAVELEVSEFDENSTRVVLGLPHLLLCGGALCGRWRGQRRKYSQLPLRRWFAIPRRRRDRLERLLAPAGVTRLTLDAADGVHLAVGVHLVDYSSPVTSKPDTARPTCVEDHVHVLRGAVSPVQRLAELEALLAHWAPEQALKACFAVDTHHILGDDVGDVLHEPGQHGVP